jgi:hypothetical protein
VFPIVLLFCIAFPQTSIGSDGFYEKGKPALRGADSGMFPDTQTRTKIDLAGDWQCSRDGEIWDNVAVPCSYDFVGKITFRRSFSVDPELLKKSFFRMVAYGVNYYCEIIINGEFVGKHTGGYTSFILKIPDNLLRTDRDNTISITVSNELNSKDTVPLRQQIWGWKSYGGIFRDIFLLATPNVWVDDVSLRTEFASGFGSAKLNLSAYITLSDLGKILSDSGRLRSVEKINVSCYSELCEKLTGISVARSEPTNTEVYHNRSTRFDAGIVVQNPKLWSPSLPSLYVLKIFVLNDGKLVDEYDVNVGLRQISIREDTVYLNGERLFLKGVSRHEDHPKYGNALDYETMEQDIISIKNLGANAVRLAHYPAHPYVLNLCDRYGLLVLEELPVWNVPADILCGERFIILAESYVREMVGRDKNHPSVLFWGIGNGFDSAELKSRAYVSKMHDVIRSLDDRPVYYASRMIVNDVCADIVEVGAVNIYCDDISHFKSMVEEWKKKHPQKPVILSEYGKEIQPNNHNGYSDPLSIDNQTKYLIDRYPTSEQSGYSGNFIWVYSDWRGDRPVLTVGEGDPFLYTKGIVSYERERRLSYDAVRALFTGDKIPSLTIGEYSDKKPIFYVLLGLALLILFAVFFNLFRQFRENVIRALFKSYNFFADVRDQRIFSHFHTLVVGIIVSGTIALVLSNIFYFFRRSVILDSVLTHFVTSDSLKAAFDSLIWNPISFTVFFTVVSFILLLAVALLVRLGAALVHKRVFLSDAYLTAIWSALPIVILIPVGMVLYRIMQTESYVMPLIGFVLLILLWIFLRLLKGAAIVYDVRPKRVYAGGIVFVLLLLGAIMLYYNITQSTIAYAKFGINILKSLQ